MGWTQARSRDGDDGVAEMERRPVARKSSRAVSAPPMRNFTICLDGSALKDDSDSEEEVTG